MYMDFTDTSNGAVFFLTLAFFGVPLYNLESVTEKRSQIDYSNSSVSLVTNVQLPALFHRNASWVSKFSVVAMSISMPDIAARSFRFDSHVLIYSKPRRQNISITKSQTQNL